MKKKHSKLALFFVLGFLILGLLICATSSVIGFNQYKSGIELQYNDKAYEIADVAETFIDKATLKEYVTAVRGYYAGTVAREQIEALIAEERYQSVADRLKVFTKGMGSNDIFFVYIDQDILNSYDANSTEPWNPLQYIFSCYEYEYEGQTLTVTLGDESPFNPKFISEVDTMLTTGKKSSDYFISKGAFGYNTTAIKPILDDDGKVMVCLCVETPMVTIENSLRSYLISAVLTTIVLILLIIAVYVVILFRRVISPINKVSQEVGGFLENNNQVSEVLKTIKTGDEIQLLAENTLQMQMDINDYINNITKITAEKERIGAELDVATHIQASMLPCIFPAFPNRPEIDIYATMNPAKEVGGDFYDFFMVDDRHLAIVVADVSGKGVPAALFMVIGKTLIKDHTGPDSDLGAVFSKVNNLLCQSNSEGLFITAFEGVLDLVTGEFNFVNAGHEMPFIYRAGEGFTPYKIKPGFVLAGMEEMKYRGGSIQLNVGDKIFQYTDGVTEATSAAEELYGMDRLTAVLNREEVKNGTPFDILPIVKADIDAFVGDAPQFDDITMLALEYRKKMEI